jgi:hypothetical protein
LQAGSDSLLTANVFYEMRRRYFEGKAALLQPHILGYIGIFALCVLGDDACAGKIDDSKYLGVLFGLGQGGLTTPVPWSTE